MPKLLEYSVNTGLKAFLCIHIWSRMVTPGNENWCKNWCSNKNWCSVWCRKSLILQYSSL